MTQTSDVPSAPPVAAQYVVTFLKPEMLHVYRQITALRAYRPVVICQKRENENDFPFADIVLQPKPRTHQLRRWWQKQVLKQPITIYRSEAQRTLAELHRLGARVLHVYFGHIGVHLLPLLEIADLPVIVSFHGADAGIDHDLPKHRLMTERMFGKCTLVLVRSESIGKRLVELGCDPAKIRVHRTGVPVNEIAFTPRVAPDGNAWRLVQASRLIPKKGLETTLRALKIFRETYPRATLLIAGAGPLKEDLRKMSVDLGVAVAVTLGGFLPQDKLRFFFEKGHMFLHPSEQAADGDREGVPNAMLEAMAAGVPVFATHHGGIPEAVEHGVSGMLVPERDHEALAAAMLEIAKDPARLTAMSEAARARVVANFDTEVHARALEGFYTEAISLAGAAKG